ncbi:33 kDa inner dynein arm light chain, axonemal [Echinococcus granulosus]|uniref:Dynein light chain n=1 Tax=Echinococcus granulosus TaxID=6210 RepID=U6J4U3_ECHGR|nr:inner dynein arm light chain, axonemal [Echinococcus granulosus]EUB62778.1 inner dynein arm light chain, axonemal [Echinococcus granulosus]KAH9281142.1 33 kDa inner dynein arm light chain, axonemal [Echinococcus granulosus]CDS19095.1 dynein light chain [Echinococcus granulosus]
MNEDQKLIVPETSLLKYKNPVRVSRKSTKSDDKDLGSFDPRKLCEMQSTESILASIMPPRRLEIKGDLFIQEVSSTPASRAEVVQLTKQLNQQLEARGAKMTGICPVRRELFSQVFDELIRQLTIHCAERGLLLLRVRNEVQTTISALQSIYASGVVFGLQKSLAREADRNHQTSRVAELGAEIANLEKRIKTEVLNCKALEEKEANRLAAATRRAEEDVNFLRKGHEQLKNQLKDVLNQFKIVNE